MASLAHKLEDIPNVGPKTATDLRLLGIEEPKQLIGQSAQVLYETICAKTGAQHDPCVEDVFAAAIDYMETGRARPWWYYSRARKGPRGVKGKRK